MRSVCRGILDWATFACSYATVPALSFYFSCCRLAWGLHVLRNKIRSACKYWMDTKPATAWAMGIQWKSKPVTLPSWVAGAHSTKQAQSVCATSPNASLPRGRLFLESVDSES